MEKTISLLSETIPSLINNTHFNISLEGWPAAISVIAICFTGSAVFTVKEISKNKSHAAQS